VTVLSAPINYALLRGSDWRNGECLQKFVLKPRNVECQRNHYVTVKISIRYVQYGLDVEIGCVWS